MRVPAAASRLVTEAFDAVPTTFGRLVLASYLLHHDTGLYVCPLASIAYGYHEINLLLDTMHRKLFGVWLGMTEARQISDVQNYLWAVDDESNSLAASILDKRSFGALLPVGVEANGRRNFMRSVAHALKAPRTSQMAANCSPS